MPPAHPRGPFFFPVALPIASFVWDVGVFAWFLAAEVLAVFSTWTITALERYSRARILEIAGQRGRRERALAHLAKIGTYDLTVRLTRFLGNSLLVVGIAYLVLKSRGADRGQATLPWGALLEALVLAFALSFLLNDVLVRLLARRRPNRFLEAAFPTLAVLRALTAPVRAPVRILAWIAFRVKLEEPGPGLRQEVRDLVGEGEREGVFTGHEADMLEGVLRLKDTTVADVLTARGGMDAVQADASLREAAAFLRQTGRSRVPVYGKDRDDVVGVLHVRDVLTHWGGDAGRGMRVREIMRPPFFVPESRPLGDFLSDMLAKKAHLAVVLNEFGAAAGIVTLEDLLEQVVGDIEDELDAEEAARGPAAGQAAAAGVIDVDGRTSIEDVNRALSVALPVSEDFETVGGLVLHRLGKVPRAGERLEVENVSLTVTEADERTVKRLRVQVGGR